MNEWSVSKYEGVEHLEKSFSFKKYSKALCFMNAVAGVAENHIHHPRMVLEWGKLTVAWGTHESESGSGIKDVDRLLSRKTDELFDLMQKA